MTYADSIQFLYGLRLFGTKLGLENTCKLAAIAGDPHRQLRFVHVAGTNGKGSSCAMLESIYRHAGLRVGLFTSPHLVSFRERIQVNRELISEGDVIRLVQQIQGWLGDFSPGWHPTFFEVVAVLALRYFVERECDLVIWETGLGGRLDATNIVTPLASVITNVQFDHEKWLGDTVAEIASEKAGIIKSGVPIITAADHPDALTVITQVAARQRAPLTRVSSADATEPPLDAIQLPLRGEHQKINAVLAVATVRRLSKLIPVSEQSLRRGLERVDWPGRLQKHVTPDGRLVLLDGAHNPAGAQTLRDAVQSYFPGRAPALVLGVMRDKDWAGMLQILLPIASRVLLAPVQTERTASPDDLRLECARIRPGLDATACASLEEALRLTEREPFVLITGSLHFIGEALELLKLLPNSAGERKLNEWDASGTPASGAIAQP